jgi:hypothetical protein
MRKIKRQMPIMAFLDGHIRIFPNMSLAPIKILKLKKRYGIQGNKNQEYQDNRRQTEHHLSLLKDGRGAKEEDNSQVTEPLREVILKGTRRSRLFRRSQECAYDR